MKILIVYLDDEKLKRCLDSLKKFSPQIPIHTIKADPKKTQIAEELYNEFIKDLDDDLMIWHSDMIAVQGWFEKVKMYWGCFDVIGCKLLYPNGLIQHYGGSIRRNGAFHPHQFSLNIGLNNILETAYVTGPGMIIKKEVLKEIKWDTEFISYPDVDFCFQAREKGFKVGVIPVELIHEEAGERDTALEKQKLKTGYEKFTAKWMHRLSNLIKNE